MYVLNNKQARYICTQKALLLIPLQNKPSIHNHIHPSFVWEGKTRMLVGLEQAITKASLSKGIAITLKVINMFKLINHDNFHYN